MEYKLYRLIDCETGKTVSCNWQYDVCTPLVTTNLSIAEEYRNYYMRNGIATKIQVTEWVDL